MDARTLKYVLVTSLGLLVIVRPVCAEEAPTPEDQLARCQAAANERTELVREGVLELIEKGAGWASTSARPEQLMKVRRYIALQERLMFECPAGFTASVHAEPAPPPPVRRPNPPPRKAHKPIRQPDVPLPVSKKAVL